MSPKRDINSINPVTDVVVIGSGAAGFTAAVAASEKGARVVLVEKHNAPGGRSVRAEGFFAADSPVQERLGIDAPRDELFRMAMDYAHWEINPRIVRAFINKSGDTVRWLEEKGVKIDRVSPFYRNQCIRTWHQPGRGGAEIIEVLLKSFNDSDGVFFPKTAAKKIMTNNKGNIAGVIVSTGGKEYEIATQCVIIATGGYGGNTKLLKKYCPFYTEDMGSSGPAYMGEGLLMATEVGAATEGLGGLHISGPRFDGTTRHAGVLCQEPDTVWVNKRGERFTDESTAFNHYESVNAILQQPGKISYSLFDHKMVENIIRRGPIKIRQGVYYGITKDDMADLEIELHDQASKGAVKISDRWEEIAQWIGVKPGILKSTIDQYNHCADRGYDESFLKERKYLVALTTPPYYAMKCRTSLIGTLGGIKVNHRMEVVDRTDKVIPGLYAAGTDVGGWEPRTYNVRLSGSTLGFPLNSGRIAGEEAAEFISRK